MLLLAIIHLFMILLFIELNYDYLNSKIIPVHLDPNIIPIIVLYIALDPTNPITRILELLLNITYHLCHTSPSTAGT